MENRRNQMTNEKTKSNQAKEVIRGDYKSKEDKEMQAKFNAEGNCQI